MNNRSLNRILRDDLGKGLTKEEVRILARANSEYELDSNDLDRMTEAELIQYATVVTDFQLPNSCWASSYDDEQVFNNGFKYR